MLSLECHVVTIIVCGSLFSRIRSRSNSFLSIFATCFIVFLNSFSWKRHSIILLHKFHCSTGSPIFVNIRRNRINCSFGIFFGICDG